MTFKGYTRRELVLPINKRNVRIKKKLKSRIEKCETYICVLKLGTVINLRIVHMSYKIAFSFVVK